jgi:predicted dehydrogenase
MGFIGTGGRGTGLLRIAAALAGVEFPALCDINPQNLARAQDVVMTTGRKRPEGYTGEQDYRKLMERDDLDAVIIATPWHWHTPMAVHSMQCGKYTAVEVPAALTVDQCWQLVDTHEKTRTQCMMLENWSFRRDNLAVLNMIRSGLLGEINHCHCAHSHDCTYWYFDKDGNPRWSGIDIYDSVLMCAPIPLSEQSIANGSAPAQFPDFTRGKWRTRKPNFAAQS